MNKVLCVDCKVDGMTTTKCKDNEFRCLMCKIHYNKIGMRNGK